MDLIIIGAGGHGREMAHLAKKLKSKRGNFPLVGFIDDNPELHGKTIDDMPVLGGIDWILKNGTDKSFVCAIGDPVKRKSVVERLNKTKINWATLIDPEVKLAKSVTVKKGAMICAGVNMTINVTIGKHAVVNMGCTLSHDLVMGDFATLACGVHISGEVTIGEGAELGVGVNVIPGVTIGEWTIIGAGSTVINDIPAKVTAVGVPAKVIREHRLTATKDH